MMLFSSSLIFILILELISLKSISTTPPCIPTGNPSNCNDYPIYVRLGFAAKVVEFLDADPNNNIPEGNPNRNILGAQQLLAFKLALNYCNHLSRTDPDYDLNNDGKLGDFYIHPVVYKGEQLFNFLWFMRKNNHFFDGAYGSYYLDLQKEVVSTVIAAQDDTDTVESMVSTFNGWNIPVYIAKSQSTYFSHAAKYPNKGRIVPADNFQALILHDVLISYNWKRVAIIYTDNTDGIDCYVNFKRSAADYNVEILLTGHFDPELNDLTSAIKDVVQSGATIILLFMSNKVQSRVLKQGYDLGLLKDNTVLIGTSFSYDTNSVMSYLSSEIHKKEMLRGYFSISWDDRAYFRVPSGQKFIQMFKTGVLNNINLMSYPHGFRDTDPASPSTNFANDAGNKWFSKCKQWEYDVFQQIYGPNIRDLSVGELDPNNDYCRSGSCGDVGKSTPANSFCANPTDCPTYIPPDSCELQYLKLCENFDADFNPLWVTTCESSGGLCGDNSPGGTPKYPAEDLVNGQGVNLYGLPKDPRLPAGMCLGLERSELDSIPNDGSSSIDPSTMYIFDAVVNVHFLLAQFIKSAVVTTNGLPTGAIDPNTGLSDQVKINDWINKDGLRSFMNTILTPEQGSTSLESAPLPSMFTGTSTNHFGFKEEDNFMYGDRVSGFVYRMNNYDEKTDSLKVSGYYDPTLKSYISCTDSGSVKVLGTDFPCQNAIYRSANVPVDMQPNEVTPMSTPMKTSLYFFGVLSLLTVIFWSVLIAINWNHKVLKLRQKYVLLFVCLSIYLGSFKVIISATWDLTEGYCGANYWLGHLSLRLMTLSLTFKLWRVDKLFNNSTLKRVKVTETDVIKRILGYTSVMLVALIIQTGLSGPKIMTRTFVKYNVLHVTPFCGLGYDIGARVVDVIIFVLQVLSLAMANFYVYRTLSVPPMINEASIIAPSLVICTIGSIITFAMLRSYNVDPIIESFVIDMIFALTGIFGSILYFGTVFHQIYLKEKKVRNKDETMKPNNNNISSGDGSSSTIIKSTIVPIDANLDNLAHSVSQALLKRAKGSENKAMVCQSQITFWRAQMLKIADSDEYSTKASSSSGSVYVDDDDTSDSITSSTINDDKDP